MGGRKRWLVFLLGTGVAALLLETFSMAHYSAPFTPVLLLLIVASARALWYRLAARPRGGLLFAPLACLLFAFLVFDYQRALMAPHETQRSRFYGQLQAIGGHHLVFVDYADGWLGWTPDGEWIYNAADPEKSLVVFAHLRSDRENSELINAYPGRTVWLVKLGPKETDVHFDRYESTIASSTQAHR
jgi:hypothetical protein